MKLLIKNVFWTNPDDPESGKQMDIRIRDGKVIEVDLKLEPSDNEQIVNADGFSCSPGWLDMKTNAPHIAFHLDEDLETLSNAAAAGGYTRILLHPNERTPLQLPESVVYFRDYKNENGVRFLVAASPTKELEGQKMTEMLTLWRFGADAFSAPNPVTNSSFFSNLLLYLQHSDKVLIHNPTDPDLVKNGQIHEGEISDRRGLAGMPSVAEEVMMLRDIALLKYNGGKLHFSSLSTAESMKIMKAEKSEVSHLSCDVCAHQLAFTEDTLDQFDTLYKVVPPFRHETDRLSLIAGIENRTIDVVVSGHTPLVADSKVIQFEDASFGISSLETTFSTLVSSVEGIESKRVVELLSTNPKRILGLDSENLKIGMNADFTLFSTTKKWKPIPENWQSKSQNNPLLNTEMTGIVLGVVTATGFHPNPHFSTVIS